MGCCCSCLGGDQEDGSPSAAETELQAQNAEVDKKILSIARGMSAPTIEVEDRTKVCRFIRVHSVSVRSCLLLFVNGPLCWFLHTLIIRKVSGCGLALAAVVIEQDTAYWEVHVARAQEGSAEAMFGVATKKDRKFYAASEEEAEGTHRHQRM
jgi:hypothetical protein